MCGIVGGIGADALEWVKTMNRVQEHRGPDDEGIYHDPRQQVCLGMRRLSILDVEHGHQPMANESGSTWIIYNGEIFNSPHLRQRLEKQHRFVTDHSDTEVLLHLYDDKQEDMLADLNGMFAFVVYDARRSILFGARDRLGIKPLYYAGISNRFAFASELKSLLTLPWIDRNLDVASLFHYLSLRFVPGRQSIFNGIFRLPPGHWFRYDLTTGAMETRRYWRPSVGVYDRRPAAEWSEIVRAELKAAVQRWTLSDVPIGCSLSGGLDSSGIVGLLAESGHRRVKTYSLGFAGDTAQGLDELPLAKQVADRWGTEHHELVLGPEELLQDLVKMVWHLDEPYGGGLPSWYVFRFMGRDVKVGLTGTGGDELFGDYGRYAALERALSAGGGRSMPGRWLRESWPSITRWLASLPEGLVDLRRKERWLHWPEVRTDSFRWLYVHAFYYFSDEMKRDLVLSPGAAPSGVDTADLLARHYRDAESADARDSCSYLALMTQLPDEFLHMTDRFSMAHSLEARVPFLDHTFVELALRIPPEIRTTPDDPKYLLRQAVRDLLPSDLAQAPKRGFVIPTARWLRGPLRPLAERLLSPERLKRQGLIRPEFHDRFVRPHLNGHADYHAQVWTVLMFQLWHELFVEYRLSEPPAIVWQDLC
ncbi:MAG: asparagine synthase (glutamine-hydrolyzing) [Nitrospiraceae bacterium]